MHKHLIDHSVRSGELYALDRTRVAKTWQQYYEDRGYELWGFSPSPTAKILAETILASNPRRSERVEILDWGCGYGRDSLYFTELGFDIIGIDVSERAIALARNAYKNRQATGVPLMGSASFHVGDMHSVFKSRAGQRVNAFFSNRVLHSLNEADFCDVTSNAIRYVEEGAHFCVSARSKEDFNTALMEWVPGMEHARARYKDPARIGHDITFVTKERLVSSMGHHLEDGRYLDAAEPDRVGAGDTRLLILIGRTRGRISNQPLQTSGISSNGSADNGGIS
jgi:SAM-dependent methyltransferase